MLCNRLPEGIPFITPLKPVDPAPWCWNSDLQNWVTKKGVNRKYTSTMEHWGKLNTAKLLVFTGVGE